MKAPNVSVIVPAFNALQYLPQCISSVQAQSYTNWELIIVNDGSTDGSKDYLDQLSDQRIRVLHTPNAGVSAARNQALVVARGDYITFLDADDALPEHSLASRVRVFIEHPEVDTVDGQVLIQDAKLSATKSLRQPGEYGSYFERLIRLDSSVFFNVGAMVRRLSLGNVRFREELTHCEDLLFFLDACNKTGWTYAAVSEPVYCYRTGTSSAMSNLDGLERGYLALMQACFEYPRASEADRDFLYKRIRRILVRSWLRRLKLARAFGAFLQLSRVIRTNSQFLNDRLLP